jgi:hypothetical protein
MAVAGREIRPTDTAAMAAFVAHYCAAHPLEQVAVADQELVNALAP